MLTRHGNESCHLTDIGIRISPEIRIQNPDRFRLRYWPWRRFVLSEHCLVIIVVDVSIIIINIVVKLQLLHCYLILANPVY